MMAGTMASTVLPEAQTSTRSDPMPARARETSSFYFYMAIVFVILAFGGFARTYLIPVATNSFAGAAILHVHGILFLAWTILFAVQTRLIGRGRVDLHRNLGLFGISLATGMFFMGFALVVRGLDYGVTTGNPAAAQRLSIVPVSGIVLFAVFFAAAIVNVRQPESHKRFMLLATVNLLTAPIARLFAMLFVRNLSGLPNFAATPLVNVPRALMAAWIGAASVDLLVIAALVRDWRMRGRPHRVYVIGLAFMLVVHALRPLIAQTEMWRSITAGIAALAA